jgi:hypothetical protein
MASEPQPKLGISRAKATKDIKLPDLAFPSTLLRTCLASWREQIPVLDSHGPPESLRKAEIILFKTVHY